MIIVYGGSFNPPTKAHLSIILKLKDVYKDAHIMMIPVGDFYHKPSLVSFAHRFEMTKLLIKDISNVSISDIERQNTYKGTLNTLEMIQEKYPNEEIKYVIGADLLETLNTWIQYQILLEKYGFIIIERDHKLILPEHIKEHFKKPVDWIHFDSEISSSKIRTSLKKHQTDLTKSVYQYIIKNKLYEESIYV